MAPRRTLRTAVKTRAKQLVVCIDNEGYATSLEKRKIYVALHDAAAEKHSLLRIVDESGEDYLRLKKPFSPDRPAAGRETSRADRLRAAATRRSIPEAKSWLAQFAKPA
jgi:hypothetical protein